MSRPVEFNESEALTSAMEAFRRRSYYGVSIKVLEQETGLSSGSLYNSFGSKDRLFARVVDHYNQIVVARRIAAHIGAGGSAAGLMSMFVSLLDEPDGGSAGCLLTNTAIEFAGGHGAAVQGVSAGFDLLLAAFERALAGIESCKKPRIGALKLLIFYQGLLVLIRHGYSKNDLHQVISNEIGSIIGEDNV